MNMVTVAVRGFLSSFLLPSSFLFHLSYESEPEKAIDGAQEAGFLVSGGTSRQMINIRF